MRYMLIVIIVALTVAVGGVEKSSASGSVSCAAHLNYGYGIKASFVAMGSPSWLVRSTCAVVREGGWKSGIALNTRKLICGATMRRYPNVNAALFANATTASTVRRYCASIFSSRDWVRYR